MAWNQPGGNGNRDPWGGPNRQQGPPDLDELLKKLQGRLSGIFGGGRPGGGGLGGGGLSLGGMGTKGIGLIAVLVFIGWGLLGIYIVEPAEEAVVLRFGKYLETTESGPHWAPYIIDRVQTVNVEQVRSIEIGFRNESRSQGIANESLMLTKDENIVDIKFAVQYRVKNTRDYLFKVRDPDLSLRQATESAVREVVGKSKMDFVLTAGRSQVAAQVQELTQNILDRYETGLQVTTVNMQSAQPPREVQDAFSDAVKAREDEQRTKNEARAFAADILPKARGDANAIREQAEAYKQRVKNAAEGDAARFLKVLFEYKKAPEVTRKRLYLEAIESVMANSSKVLVDVEGGNNLLYLPLDKLISPRAPAGGDTGQARFGDTPSTSGFSGSGRQRSNLRGRSR